MLGACFWIFSALRLFVSIMNAKYVCTGMCMYNEEEAGSYCCKIDVTGVDVRELLRSLLFVCHR